MIISAGSVKTEIVTRPMYEKPQEASLIFTAT